MLLVSLFQPITAELTDARVYLKAKRIRSTAMATSTKNRPSPTGEAQLSQDHEPDLSSYPRFDSVIYHPLLVV
jgi:hypothetical protein